ncbi:hypothetical protein P154DRAFT_203439 [Amniculicola lignicola CBS 123094]|uniref:Uncharacterized protein n=1 Tax=Amniculicola lignicola CBS 123094 TaxID=1392246 RepID=A0A6A5VXR3_9PLEO|nr:hypothetical protein P154DRAFT_203439 [Amniculicola lignicola CBS 123094]
MDRQYPTPNGFLAKFPTFKRDPADGLEHVFELLTLHEGWSKKSKKQRQRKAELFEEEFKAQFTEGKTKLESWQALCKEVGIDPVPSSITQCRKALHGVLVNIVNLMDHRQHGAQIPLIKFASLREFRKYTRVHTFPKREAKQEGFIKDLLRYLGGRNHG